MKQRFLTVAEVLFIHSAVVEETGGEHGLRDLGLLESAVRGIEQSFGGQDLYPSIPQKGAALFVGLLKNHPFIDGNKRTALTAMGVFLSLNGVTLQVRQDALAKWVESNAGGRPTVKAVQVWIESHS